MTIRFLDALAGSGKTRALARHAMRLSRAGERVLFVQPSKLLIDATIRQEFRGMREGLLHAIHGDVCNDVVQKIMQNIRSATAKPGEILFITHEAFMRLPHIENRKDWHLIFDEVPTVDVCEPFRIPETHEIITQSLRFESQGAAYGIITADPCSGGTLRKIAQNSRDDEIWGRFSGFARRVLSEHWDVYALQSSYRGLVSGERDVRQLVTHSLLKPSLFNGLKEVMLASALFTNSTLFKLWSAQGDVEFQDISREFGSDLRYREHGNGSALTVRYLMEQDWSKTQRDKGISYQGRETCLKHIIPTLVEEALRDQPFAWMGNKDIPNDYFGALSATRLPNSPHGLNGYQHLHHVVVMAALNAPPAHFKFMDMKGLPPDELRTANYRSAVYQAAMRVSLRNPADETPKSVTVMDASTAHWLAALFPGARVHALSNSGLDLPRSKRGRPRKYNSDRERKKAWRERRKATLIAESTSPTPVERASGFGSIFATRFDTEALDHLEAGNVAEFISFLRDSHQRRIASKTEDFLISPAYFDPSVDGCSTQRGLPNVQHVNGIWLDNDGGDLSPEHLAIIFPQLWMAIWNTYSSTAIEPRWRCFIPTDRTMSADEYACLIRQIELSLHHRGYVGNDDDNGEVGHQRGYHGFDRTKFHAAALFYAPCQAEDREGSFFLEFKGGYRQALNVDQWLRATDHAEESTWCLQSPEICLRQTVEVPVSAVAGKEDEIAKAIARWRSTPRGQGNHQFFRLASDLHRNGIPRDIARDILASEAAQAHSPSERRVEAPRLLARIWGP